MTSTTSDNMITTQEGYIKLRSNAEEGEAREFAVTKDAILISETIKNLCEEFEGDVITIPLPNISASILEKVVEYLEHFHENPPSKEDEEKTEAEKRSAEIPEWEREYCNPDKIGQPTLFNLILAANYLDIKPLLNLTCKTVANMIKGKTPQEIKELFGVTRDFTPEEEEQVRKENPWLVEK